LRLALGAIAYLAESRGLVVVARRIRWALRLTGCWIERAVLPPPPCRCILGSRRAFDAMLPLPIGASIEIQRIDGHVSRELLGMDHPGEQFCTDWLQRWG
jgi:hypothetical protein